MKIGIISDTHSLLRVEAKAVLSGCDAIVHAGDIGRPAVLDELRALAPLTVIRGNIDTWAEELPDTASVEFGGRRFYILHNLHALDFDPREAGYHGVISGHSHLPKIVRRDGVIYINPGSAGPRRFKLPVAIAWIHVSRRRIDAQIVELPV